MKLEEMKNEIIRLDAAIEIEKDDAKKIALIDEQIALNKEYIHALTKSIPVRIVFCVILSLLYLIGLIIFLPGIIIRRQKANACNRRIIRLETIKADIINNRGNNNE